MKLNERIEAVINNKIDMDADTIDKLIYFAYMAGCERATKRTADAYNKILKEQIERAENCRYHNVAMKVQGDIKNLYFDDYAQDFQDTFGLDETNL